MDVQQFWADVLRQDATALRTYFHPDAWINWNCTNEHFTVEEYIRANCEYPGEWDGEVEQVVRAGDTLVTATHVFTKDRTMSFHVASFLKLRDGKIASMEEYWGDDGEAPQWRQEKHIGCPIKE